jgi:hypothetical protein
LAEEFTHIERERRRKEREDADAKQRIREAKKREGRVRPDRSGGARP